MTIEEIRKNIDRLDARIVKLLNDRMEQALMVRKLKQRIEDPEREQQVLQQIRRNATELIHPEFIERIYLDIIQESKAAPAKKPGADRLPGRTRGLQRGRRPGLGPEPGSDPLSGIYRSL